MAQAGRPARRSPLAPRSIATKRGTLAQSARALDRRVRGQSRLYPLGRARPREKRGRAIGRQSTRTRDGGVRVALCPRLAIPGPTEHSSCYTIDAQTLIIESRCCEAQSLLEVFGLEKGVFGEQRGSVGICRKQFENATNSDPHRPDAWLPAALSWLDRNPIEQVYRRHIPSLDHIRYRHPDSRIL